MAPTAPSPSHYSPAELAEFEALIRSRLAQASKEFENAKNSLLHGASNSTDDTYTGRSTLEDGQALMEREELMRIALRQEKFMEQLREALVRIRRGDYGICRVSGTLIPKERLRLVPHATMTVPAKNSQRATA